VHEGSKVLIEVVAIHAEDIIRFRQQVVPPPPALRAKGAAPRKGALPFTIALVGPTGSGKTTTAAKLALHADVFGGRKIGFITLATHRADSPERLRSFAGAAGIPMEVVRDIPEVDRALKRMSAFEVIIIDTPGHGPRGATDNTMWRSILNRAQPNETHLVVSADTRLDLVRRIRADFISSGATHLLLTKLDEVPNDATIAQLASELLLPVRWVGDGQYVPIDLHPARTRLLPALGVAPAVEVPV
jgi:flagellar biosynthesis protein FlhF